MEPGGAEWSGDGNGCLKTIVTMNETIRAKRSAVLLNIGGDE